MKRLFSVRTLRAHLFFGEGWGARLLGRGASTLFDAGASIFCSGASIFLARARRAYVAPIFRSMGASTFCGDKIGRVYFLYGLVSFLVLARLFFCAGFAVSAWWWEGRAEGGALLPGSPHARSPSSRSDASAPEADASTKSRRAQSAPNASS